MAFHNPLLSLPTEMLFSVARLLHGKDLRALSQTNGRLRDVASIFIHKGPSAETLHGVPLWAWQNPTLNIERKRPTPHPNNETLERVGIINGSVDPELLYEYNTLIYACETGDAATVQDLLRRNVSSNPPKHTTVDDRERLFRYRLCWYTPLEAAIRANSIECVDLLINAGATFAIFDFEDTVRLLCSRRAANAITLQALIHRGLDINCQGSVGYRDSTMYLCPGDKRNVSLLSALVLELRDKNAPLDPKSGFAAMKLLLENGLKVNMQHSGSCRIFEYAVGKASDEPCQEELDVIRLLFRSSDGVNVPCDRLKYTPLHIACKNGKLEVAKILINEFDADSNATTECRTTPLVLAVQKRVISLDDTGKEVETLAYKRRHIQLVELLIGSGASLLGDTQRIDDSTSPLLEAARANSPALPTLVNAWVRKYGFNHQPHVLLVAAAAMGDMSILQRLLLQGSPGRFPEHTINMAMDRAALAEREEAVKLLLPYATSIRFPGYNRLAGTTLQNAAKFAEETFLAVLALAKDHEIADDAYPLLRQVVQDCAPLTVSLILERIHRPLGELSQRLLAQAAWLGNLETSQVILERMQRENSSSRLSMQSIAMAADNAVSRGHTGIVKALLDVSDLDVNTTYTNGQSLLSLAVSNNQVEMVTFLIERGVNVAAIDSGWRLPRPILTYPQPSNPVSSIAASRGFSDVLKILLDHGADINSVDIDDPLHLLTLAAKNDHADVVRLLIEEYGVQIDQKDLNSNTALSHAARCGHFDIVRLLLDTGAEVDVTDDYGRTPFFHSLTGAVPLYLYPAGQIDFVDTGTAWMDKTTEEKVQCGFAIAALLLERGANRNIRDNYGRSPFSYIVSESPDICLQLSINLGFDIDEVDSAGRTAFSWACSLGLASSARALKNAGCDIFKADNNEMTPLHYAADCVDIVKIMYAGQCQSRMAWVTGGGSGEQAIIGSIDR